MYNNVVKDINLQINICINLKIDIFHYIIITLWSYFII